MNPILENGPQKGQKQCSNQLTSNLAAAQVEDARVGGEKTPLEDSR